MQEDRKWLILKALLLLLYVAVKLRISHFEEVWDWLCSASVTSNSYTRRESLEEIGSVLNAVSTASRFSVFHVRCLEQSMVVYRLLKQRGLQVSICVGVQKHPFCAHAWVEHDGRVINDSQQVKDKYCVILEN